MDRLSELYQEVILEHANDPRNFGVPGWAWRHLKEKCPCSNPRCDKKYWVYYLLEKNESGFRLYPEFRTKYHARHFLSDNVEEVYGPFPLFN